MNGLGKINNLGVPSKILKCRHEDYKRLKKLAIGLCREALGFCQCRWNDFTLKLKKKEPHSNYNCIASTSQEKKNIYILGHPWIPILFDFPHILSTSSPLSNFALVMKRKVMDVVVERNRWEKMSKQNRFYLEKGEG